MLGIEKDKYVVSGTLRIECKDGEDPLRDILDYDMKCTEEIFFSLSGRQRRQIYQRGSKRKGKTSSYREDGKRGL